MNIAPSTTTDKIVMQVINNDTCNHGLTIYQDIGGEFYWYCNGIDSSLLDEPKFYPSAIGAVSGAFAHFCCC